jgi:hypothetical protein
LPVRPEFHPKRNQARQKLATLSISKFKDLSTDVLYELERRFPETGNIVSPSRSENFSARDDASYKSDSINQSSAASPERKPPAPAGNSKFQNYNESTNNSNGIIANIDDADIRSLDNLMDDLGQILKSKKGSKSRDLNSQEDKLSSPKTGGNDKLGANIERLEDMVSEQSKVWLKKCILLNFIFLSLDN